MLKEYYFPVNEDELEDLDQGVEDDGLGQNDVVPQSDVPTEQGATVELDVTDIVAKQDEILARMDALAASIDGGKVEQLVAAHDQKLSDMDGRITQHLDNLERELKMRNPTTEEQMQLNSKAATSFNTSVEDYMADKNRQNQEAREKIILTKDDVENYDSYQIANSF